MTEPVQSPALPAIRSAGSRLRRGLRFLFPGDRRVWRWSLLVLIPGVLLLAHEVLKPAGYYTSSDSVAPTILLPTTSARQPLCTAGVPIGPNTGVVDLSYGWPDGGPAPAVVTVSIGGHVVARGMTRVHPNAAPAVTPVPVSPTILPRGPGETGTVCVRDLGRRPLQLAGFPSTFPGLRTTVGGKPTQETIAIWMSPPRGETRSLADNWAAMMRRLTVFRPAFAGVVFYWALFLLGLPLLAYLGVRLLAQAAFLSTRRLALWIAVIAFCGAGAWAVTTYAFDAPDEPSHFAYTQLLARTGHAPAASVGSPYSDALTGALNAVHQYTLTGQGLTGGRRPWTGERVGLYQRTVAETHPDQDNGAGFATATAPHSPLYYALLIPGYLLGHSNIFTELFWMRLTSALLGAVVGVCVLLTLRELVPSRPEWAVGGALLVGFMPMVNFMAGAVNNDNGVNAMAALSVYLTVRLIRRGPSPLRSLCLGISLALLPLMKATGFALFPAEVVVLLVLLLRGRSLRTLASLVPVAVGFGVIFGIWALLAHHFDRSVVPIPSNIIPSSAGTVVAAGDQASTGSTSPLTGLGVRFVMFLEVFFPNIPGQDRHFAPGVWPLELIYIKRGFADFGWGGVMFPNWIYTVIEYVMAGAGALGLVALGRRLGAVRRHWLEAVFLILVILGVIFVVEYSYYTASPRPPNDMPEQGRYAFTALVPLAVLAVSGTLAFRRSIGSVLLTLGASTMIIFAIASHLLYLQASFT